MNEDCLKEGFIYWDQMTSPDGSIRVLYGYTGGEKTPVIVEPRIINVESGEVLLDLWHTSFNGQVEFHPDGTLTIKIEDPYYRTVSVAVVDVQTKTFIFTQSTDQREPLTMLPQRLDEARRAAVRPHSPTRALIPETRTWQYLTLAGVCLIAVAVCALFVFYGRAVGRFAPTVGLSGMILFGIAAIFLFALGIKSRR